MEAIIPYLMFNGNAAEAPAFYCKALEGLVVFQQTLGEVPMETPAGQKHKIMHASFKAGDVNFMVSDAMPDQIQTRGTNLSLSLNFLDVAGIEKTFAALSEDAKITMPLQDTFQWMFNHDIKKDDKS